MTYHAKLGPSSAFRWTDCTASVGAQDGRPNTTNPASRMGTCGHQVAAECLEHGYAPNTYLGRVMGFPAEGREDWIDKMPAGVSAEYTCVVDDELVELVTAYVGFVRRYIETHGGTLLVEQSVPIDHITGELEGRGTSDVVVIGGKLLTVIDLKLGRSKVYAYDLVSPSAVVDPLTGEVEKPKTRMNLQLALYALGSLEQFELLGDFERVRVIIVQPAVSHVSEFDCSVAELKDLGEWIKVRSELTRTAPEFVPSNKNCFFCKAKFDCHARSQLVIETCLDGFDDITDAPKTKPVEVPALGKLYGAIDFIRSWCDDVEAKTVEQVKAGKPVIGKDGYPMKFVEGRKGNKVWRDASEVEALISSWHLKGDPMHVTSLITPTQAEKLAKGKKGEESVIGPIRWPKLAELVTQPAGKPTLTLGSDPRAALPTQEDMPDMT